ncbi:MAG TPA: putative metal-dependent hydrolase [bacterium]|nr:putative metal-dependent hydrolase [bacterium]
MEAPQYPVGPNPKEEENPPRKDLIAIIEKTPQVMREAVAGLSDAQLDTKYRNWTIRQIVHHLADSHANSYIRFKWALTEDQPVIKAYDETKWADLDDSKKGPIEPSLALLEGIHKQWVVLLRSMTDEQFNRAFIHPSNNRVVTLKSALGTYAWHGRHHTGAILWMREQKRV